MPLSTWRLILGLLAAADGGATSPVLGAIRERYRATLEHQRRFTQREVNVEGCGGEGARLLAFLDGKEVRMVVLTRYGELGRTEREVHFFEGRVDFVYERAVHYDGPFGDPVSVDEDRFYFKDEHLYLWTTGPSRRPVSATRLEAHEEKLVFQARAAAAAVSTGVVRCEAVLE